MGPPLHPVKSHEWKPKLLCGIDFGMTCTGVAYTEINASGNGAQPNPNPTNIQRWLGISNSYLVDKVPSEIAFDDAGKLSSWGALCREDFNRSSVTRLFKLNLAPLDQDEDIYGHTTEAAQKYFTTYIKEVYEYVEHCFTVWHPGYKDMDVEYVFSVPTTWSAAIVNELKSLIEVNVMGNSRKRRVHIGLTEAEAAAVEVGMGKRFKKDDVVLVCDAGGGTTDVNILKITSTDDEPLRLEHMTYVEGSAIGSTRIDQEAENYLCQTVGRRLGPGFDAIAKEAVARKFQDYKHLVGTSGFKVPELRLPLPGLEPNTNMPSVSVQNSNFILPYKELQRWFDIQINGIIDLIDAQISKLQKDHRKMKISYFVFSGGFGSNEYLREKLNKHLEQKALTSHSGIKPGFGFLMPTNPQLAVVRGLVFNRAQELLLQNPVFAEVCCRESYGVVTQERFNKRKHRGERPVLDPSDGKEWVHGRVDWIVQQGVMIPSEGLTKTYSWAFEDGEENESWTTEVVCCATIERAYLPPSINHREVHKVCTIEVDIKDLKRFKEKKKRKTYNVVKFDLRFIPGAADLRFQVHPKGEDDTLVSMPHEEIRVDWVGSRQKEQFNLDSEAPRQRAPYLNDQKTVLGAGKDIAHSFSSISLPLRKK